MSLRWRGLGVVVWNIRKSEGCCWVRLNGCGGLTWIFCIACGWGLTGVEVLVIMDVMSDNDNKVIS
jgi:hypothetical protein